MSLTRATDQTGIRRAHCPSRAVGRSKNPWGWGQVVMCWDALLICQPPPSSGSLAPLAPLGSDRTALEFADGRVSFKMEFGMLHLLHERRWVELAKFTKPYCSSELWLLGSDALTLKEMYLYDFWHQFFIREDSLRENWKKKQCSWLCYRSSFLTRPV